MVWLNQELVLIHWGQFCKERYTEFKEKWCNCFLWWCQRCG